MNEFELIKQKMLDLGFSHREAKVYTIMFKKKDFTATEIQKLVDIPRTKVYEVLHKLIAKGFCTEKKIGRNKKYEVTNPRSSFNNLIEQFRQETVQKEKSAYNAIDILSSVYEQRKENDNPLDYIEVIKDINQIHKKWLSFLESAKEEVLSFTKGPFTGNIDKHNKKVTEMLKNLIMKKGVKILTIYEYNDILRKEFFKMVSDWAHAGEQIRVCNSIPMKLFIFDESTSMFSLNDPISSPPSITTMIVNHKSFAVVLKHVFLSYWSIATPFDEFVAQQKNKKW